VTFGLTNFRNSLVLTFLLLALSCTFTSIKPNTPDFITDQKTIATDIKRLIDPQEISLSGSDLKTQGQSTSELAITLINAENPPKVQDQFSHLAKEIAQLLKRSLKNENQYDRYKIIFLFEKTSGIVTKSKSAEFYFKSSEL
jgi:hypothetical protein